MRVLLDTHVALWVVGGQPIAIEGRRALETADDIVLSVVSPWEITIKAALGKIALHRPIEDLTTELVREFGARVLPVELRHVLRVGALPPHHGDPFDRLLIAQALVEDLAVVTRDAAFGAYGIDVVQA